MESLRLPNISFYSIIGQFFLAYERIRLLGWINKG